MPQIHPSAIVHPRAQLAEQVVIGAFSIIDEFVVIGAGTVVSSHVHITGHTSIGQHNKIGSFTVLGGAPQDKKYAGEPTKLIIGDHNTLFEYVTINTGTIQDKGITSIGSHNWIMAYVHIAHDCQLGNQTILSNNAQLAGHVNVADWAIIGGMAGVHQFCRIGAHAMIGAKSLITLDVAPYVTAAGMPAKAATINSEGLSRRGFSVESINRIRQAFKTIYKSGNTLVAACAAIEADAAIDPAIADLLTFLRAPGRGLLR